MDTVLQVICFPLRVYTCLHPLKSVCRVYERVPTSDEEDEGLGALTETMRPSFGMKAGLLLSRSLVCRVLKLISS